MRVRALEDTETGRLVISAFVLVVVLCLIANAWPSTAVTRPLGRPTTALFGFTGLDQGWGLFAPNPRREQIDVSVRVEFADGSSKLWRLPAQGPLFGAKRDYRWLKWMEFVVSFSDDMLARGAARYAARALAEPGQRPVRAIVTRRRALMPVFGTAARRPWTIDTTVIDLEPRR